MRVRGFQLQYQRLTVHGLAAIRGRIVVDYRSFRNTDPPHLIAVWNEAFPTRGAPKLATSTNLERYVLAKSIFDPRGLIVAEENGERLGFVHAGMSRYPFNTKPVGVTCMIGVKPRHRRRGIGGELLQR